MDNKYEKEIKQYLEEKLSCSAHDLEHVYRVYNLALNIYEEMADSAPGVIDLEVLKAATLLHDIARVLEDQDVTGEVEHASLGADQAEKFLESLVDFPKSKIQHVKDCIISHRYRTDKRPTSVEAQILFDADKLDSIGAIGIARSFVWVGSNKAKIYNVPESLDEYVNENMGGSRNGIIKDNRLHSVQVEFELKLKQLPKLLHTEPAKRIAAERMEFFETFLKRLEDEILGKK